MFLPPCSQRILFLLIDLVFLLIFVVVGVRKLFSIFSEKDDVKNSTREPLLEVRSLQARVTLWFNLILGVMCVLTIAYTVLCGLASVQGIESSWDLIEVMFYLIQALTFAVILMIVAHEKKFRTAYHPTSVRFYWIMNFGLVVIVAVCGIIRLLSIDYVEKKLKWDDIMFLVSLPLSSFLLVFAIRGLSGIVVVGESEIGRNSRTQKEKFAEEICDPLVSVYKGQSMPKEIETFLLSCGLKNALYSIRAVDLIEGLFGTIVACPFQYDR